MPGAESRTDAMLSCKGGWVGGGGGEEGGRAKEKRGIIA